MQINITVEGPEGGRSGPVTVGWFLTQDKGAVLFDAPGTPRLARHAQDPCKIGGTLPGGDPDGEPLFHGQKSL